MKQKRFVLLLSILISIAWTFYACNRNSGVQESEEEMPDVISYNFDVRPILSDKCFACHGPDAKKRQAGLRLDDPALAFQALKEHPGAHAWVAGEPNESEAYLRITSKDSTKLMPPATSNLKLNGYEIAVIKNGSSKGPNMRNIGLLSPEKPELPEIDHVSWAKNEIDYFIAEKQEQKGLEPNEEADKERLLKRLSIDLTGLPPTLSMMDRFLADKSPNAYEKMIDELLKNPAYGEKMAIYWLDLARYADSHGYQDDGYRTQWPWRDWVIHALNKNMPYDQFVTWQLAGDFLINPAKPNLTKELLLATGFNRNHKITEEGGVIQEEYRLSYVTDRNDLFGKAFLGMTLECAHCHDHKYDPFSQKDYYQMFAFLITLKKWGSNPSSEDLKPMRKNP